MKKSRLLLIGGITLLGFPVLGWILLLVIGDEPRLMFRANWQILPQAILGMISGTILGFLAVALLSTKFLRPAVLKYVPIVRGMNLNTWSIIALSFCAGFGEELFFRGALQPYLGIWLCALIFVAIHGYLNPKNWRICLYGIFMTLAIAGLGYATEIAGIWAACFAHMFIDIILFRFLLRLSSNPSSYRHLANEFD